jgi:hypothetical protein
MMIHCAGPKEVPTTMHYAVVMFSTMAARYPDEDPTPVQHYIAFTDWSEWEDHVRRLVESGTTWFVAMQVQPATIKTSVTLNVNGE